MKPTNSAADATAKGRRSLEASPAWQQIRAGFLASGRAAAVQHDLTAIVDTAVTAAFEQALAPVLSGRAALFAVGAFGRGQLFPWSDVRILVVRDGAAPLALGDAVGEFVRLLWEAGIRPSQRVCTIADCLVLAEQNPELGSKLLDRRFLAGDSAFAAEADRALEGWFRSGAERLAKRLSDAATERHARFANTPFHREPDVRDAPGGWRDVTLLAVLAKLLPGELAGTVPAEASAFLATVRCYLHYRNGEDRNELDIAAQLAGARDLAGGANATAWMRQYFRHARSVYRAVRYALESIADRDASEDALSSGNFAVRGGRVYLRAPGSLAANPAEFLELGTFVASHNTPTAAAVENEAYEAGEVTSAFCEGVRPLWPRVREVLSLPYPANALRSLDNSGSLPLIFPEWARVDGVVEGNANHPYTAGEFTIRCVEWIGALRRGECPEEQRFAELLEDPVALLHALLFHRMGTPAEAAAAEREAAVRFGAPEELSATAGFLIGHQNALLDAAAGRDLDDPKTLMDLAGDIGTVERLRLLVLLTWAGIMAGETGPGTGWRLERLWKTYLTAQRALTRELETGKIDELPSALAADAEFLKGFPARYLRSRSAEEIAAHVGLWQASQESGVAIELEPSGGAYKLTIVAADRPALFASFAGALSSFGMDIVKAEAFGNSRGTILDTFVFTDARRTFEHNPSEADRLRDMIRRVALGKTEARRLMRNQAVASPKPLSIAPQVEFDSEACTTATLVEIETADRPGLLYSLASVFSSNGCEIDTVLIDTRGQRAVDVFYVARSGAKLAPEMQTLLKAQLIAACQGR